MLVSRLYIIQGTCLSRKALDTALFLSHWVHLDASAFREPSPRRQPRLCPSASAVTANVDSPRPTSQIWGHIRTPPPLSLWGGQEAQSDPGVFGFFNLKVSVPTLFFRPN